MGPCVTTSVLAGWLAVLVGWFINLTTAVRMKQFLDRSCALNIVYRFLEFQLFLMVFYQLYNMKISAICN